MIQKPLGVFHVLFSPTVHAHFLASFPYLCCTVLCLSLGTRDSSRLCLRKVLPFPNMALFSSHTLFFPTGCYYQQSLVITNNLHYYYLQSLAGSTAIQTSVFETYTLAFYLLGFYIPTTETPARVLLEKTGLIPNQGSPDEKRVLSWSALISHGNAGQPAEKSLAWEEQRRFLAFEGYVKSNQLLKVKWFSHSGSAVLPGNELNQLVTWWAAPIHTLRQGISIFHPRLHRVGSQVTH